MDLNKKSFTIDFQGRPLTLEVSRLAEQTNAAVICHYGDTAVLATAVMSKNSSKGDYLPLTVDYEQRFYAVGKILGSRFMRREGRAPDDAILAGRLVDRTIRPLFDQRIRREIQVILTVLSFDGENDHPFAALMAASAALAISDIPWGGPVAGVNIARLGGALQVNPKLPDVIEPEFDAFVAGTKDRINMIELEGREASEDATVEGFTLAQKEIAKLVALQEKMVKEIGKPKAALPLVEPDEELKKKVAAYLKDKIETAVYTKEKVARQEQMATVHDGLMEHLKEGEADAAALGMAEHLFEDMVDVLVHEQILTKERRPDGRKLDEVRELYTETHVLERLHGSALFIRGNTQALAVVTLAPPSGEQLVETMDFSGKKRFLLHYNFPKYSVGETGPMRGPGRREIGHAALAEKAIVNLLPSKETFPYAIRLVSEILSSNGSSSMATVCAGSMALMDAGVPMKKLAAGIAMGLMTGANGEYKVLTDIQGPEDHYGDMDFKIAGTRDGVNAIQLDVKIQGLTVEMAAKTLAQAKAARLHILSAMEKTIAAPRATLSKYAPAIIIMPMDPEKFGLIIGPGGKMINGIIAKTGVMSIDIDQTGFVYITGASSEIAEAAKREIEGITKEYKVGDIVEGNVVRILEFGAIVDLGGDQDGMIHVSELKEGFVKTVTEVLKLGDHVRVKVVRSEHGKIGLSLKAMGQEEKSRG
ncbi:MAG: polyribonucleotide nucleotidyltransferase [bacterium]|nr:polyribonucleotide nucleotidyltransferase [bacterium]